MKKSAVLKASLQITFIVLIEPCVFPIKFRLIPLNAVILSGFFLEFYTTQIYLGTWLLKSF